MSVKPKHLGSVQVAQPRANRSAAAAGSASRANAGASRRHRPRYGARKLTPLGLTLWVLGVVVVGMLVGSVLIREITTPKGTIATTQISYNFGDVPIGGGDITTSFPLTVLGNARAIDITSS